VVGILAIAIAIVVAVKCYFKNTVFTTPEKDDFRTLPALSL
jgi:hypothetical protein